MIDRELSQAQERRLLAKHTKGDFGPGSWQTIEALLTKGYIVEQDKHLVLTDKGRNYCDLFHTTIHSAS